MQRIPGATVDTKVLKLTLLTFMEDRWSRMIDAWLFGIGEDLPATLVDALGHFFDGWAQYTSRRELYGQQ